MPTKRVLDGMNNDESWITTEQLALIGFAARLQSQITNVAEISLDGGDVREEAQLLMSLVSSKPPYQETINDNDDDSSLPLTRTRQSHHPNNHHCYRDTFAFTCPSLSLKSPPPTDSTQRRNSNGSNSSSSDDSSSSSVPSLESQPPPAQLLGRPLKADDRNALRLSAEAMARNIMESFQEALEWRTRTWMYSLANALVQKEQLVLDPEKKDNKSPVSSMEELVQSKEAKVLLSLHHAASNIHVNDVKTTFRVLSKRIATITAQETTTLPPKKRLRMTTTASEHYQVKHALSFQAVITLETPAGHTEVMVQTPGTITGVFAKGKPEEETLKGVVVELDTNILATTFERSSRIVVRSAAESSVQELYPKQQEQEEVSDLEEDEEETVLQEDHPQGHEKEELPCMATPTKDYSAAAVVTPRHASPPSVSVDSSSTKPIFLSLKDEEDGGGGGVYRTISPQPKMTDLSTYLFTPKSTSTAIPTSSSLPPSLVSPSPTTPLMVAETTGEATRELSSKFPDFDNNNNKKPSLPALVEVACAAMRAC